MDVIAEHVLMMDFQIFNFLRSDNKTTVRLKSLQ